MRCGELPFSAAAAAVRLTAEHKRDFIADELPVHSRSWRSLIEPLYAARLFFGMGLILFF